MIIENKEQAELELIKRTNRRRMAWSSLIAIFIVMGICFIIPDEKAKTLEEIITLFFIANASIVAGYFGFSAWMSRK
jgi:hypothetical protein